MNKRITLTDRECRQIVKALEHLQDEPGINYLVTLAGKQVYQDIIDKLSVDKKPEPKQ